ncbi:MAG: hypothetical protein GXO97_04575 [Nitrospirae bacterium]|nr:hypothetical protein [Nitrospirota bacterium]
MVHHPIDAMGFKIIKRQGLFSLQVIQGYAGVCYCRYCYMGILHQLCRCAMESLYGLVLLLNTGSGRETNPVDCIIF